MSIQLNKTLGDMKLEKLTECNNFSPYTLAVFHNNTKQLMFGADANIDPISGSLCLDNGIFKGLHRQYWDLTDERTRGTPGGDFPANEWIPRTFTESDGVSGMGVHLQRDNKTVLLEPGIYYVKANAPALGVGDHQIRVQNLSTKLTEKYGSNASSSSDENMTNSIILGFRLNVLHKPQKFQLQHKCSGGRPTDGMGKPSGFSDGLEVYAMLSIYRMN